MNIVTSFDISVLNFIRENFSNQILDTIMSTITKLGNGGFIWILLTILLLVSKKHRDTGVILIFSLLINAIVVNLVIKPIIGRVRPYDLIVGTNIIIDKLTDYSFPSGHTAISFAFVSVIWLYGKSKLFKVSTTLLAFSIAFSRLYLYVHYPTDVVIGAIIGIISGLYAKRLFEKNILEKSKN